jgi:hypothetical protein
MEKPQHLKPLDRSAMKSLQGLVPVELIGDRPVHWLNALGLLAKQKEIHRAGKSKKCCLFGRIIL